MRNMRSIALIILSWLICAGSGVAQGPPSGATSQTSHQDLTTVYVYRYDEGTVVLGFLIKTRPVYFNDRSGSGPKPENIKIAGLRNKRYFVLRLPPGKYNFDTRLMWGRLELEVAAGSEYYLRLDQGNDCPSEDPAYAYLPPTCEDRTASIHPVSRERWEKDKSVLDPIKSGDVKDRRLVIIPTGPPT